MSVLEELLVKLGYDYDDKDLANFEKSIDRTKKSIAELTKFVLASAAAMTGLTVKSTQTSDELGKFADEVGTSVEEVDALQFSLTRAGGQAEGMSSSLRNLSIRASEAARGIGSGVEAFGLLDISATDARGNIKSTSTLFIEISKQLQGLSKAKQIELADKLGVRDSIRLLQQGPNLLAPGE